MKTAKSVPFRVATAVFVAMTCTVPVVASTPQVATEQARQGEVEALIASVARQRGVVFIRNGSEYDAQQAADHLRRKLRAAGDRVHTAEEMIDLLGTRSSLTGIAYRVRLADGRTLDSATWLRGLLRELRAAENPAVNRPGGQ